jgi:hypothetical protein
MFTFLLRMLWNARSRLDSPQTDPFDEGGDRGGRNVRLQGGLGENMSEPSG